MDMDFATGCPLVRPMLPRIRFLFVGSRLCSTLPSDNPSRCCPCASLVLHLHQVAQGTLTPRPVRHVRHTAWPFRATACGGRGLTWTCLQAACSTIGCSGQCRWAVN